MTLQRDRTRINAGGGLLEISTDGGSNWDPLSYASESKLLDDTATEDAHDESGDLQAVLHGNIKVQFDTTLLQTTLEEFNFIRNNKGTDILARYYTTLNNGNNQLFALGVCQVNPKIELTFNTSKRTLAVSLVLFKGSSTGKYYDIAETATDPPDPGDWPDVS